MIKAAYVSLLMLTMSVGAAAIDRVVEAPEIDATTVVAGVGLMAAALVVIRARSKRR